MRIWKKLLFLVTAVASIGYMAHFYYKNSPQTEKLKIVVNWKPNPNHSGLFVAIEKGFFAEENIEITLLPFGIVRPEKLVSIHKADVAILYGKDLMFVNEKEGLDITAIASLLSENTQYVATKESSGIFHPQDFANKSYASHANNNGEIILNQLIKNDGGEGVVNPFRLNIYGIPAFLDNKIDLLWVFDNIESPILAREMDTPLRRFYLKDLGLGNYGTPLLVVNTKSLEQKRELFDKFLRATQKGYYWAAQHPEEAADILVNRASKGSFIDKDLLLEQQKSSSAIYLKNGVWGKIDEKEMDVLAEFFISHGLAKSKSSLKYSNHFFEMEENKKD